MSTNNNINNVRERLHTLHFLDSDEENDEFEGIANVVGEEDDRHQMTMQQPVSVEFPNLVFPDSALLAEHLDEQATNALNILFNSEISEEQLRPWRPAIQVVQKSRSGKDRHEYETVDTRTIAMIHQGITSYLASIMRGTNNSYKGGNYGHAILNRQHYNQLVSLIEDGRNWRKKEYKQECENFKKSVHDGPYDDTIVSVPLPPYDKFVKYEVVPSGLERILVFARKHVVPDIDTFGYLCWLVLRYLEHQQEEQEQGSAAVSLHDLGERMQQLFHVPFIGTMAAVPGNHNYLEKSAKGLEVRSVVWSQLSNVDSRQCLFGGFKVLPEAGGDATLHLAVRMFALALQLNVVAEIDSP